MDVEAGREVDLVEKVAESGYSLAVELDVVQMLTGADLLLVPRAIAEDQPVQGAEAVALGVTPRLCPDRGHELARLEPVGAVAVDEHPRMGCGRRHDTAEAGPVPRRQPSPAIA